MSERPCCVDASVSHPDDGIWAFVPIEFTSESKESFHAILGLTFLGDRPPKRWELVGIINSDDEWEKKYWSHFAKLAASLGISIEERSTQ